MFKSRILRSSVIPLLAFSFLINSFTYPYAVAGDVFLPAPGVMVPLSPEFNPPILKGIKVYPDNPFRFDFILDHGSELSNDQLKDESVQLIKYFLASLTIPEKDLWVNLSPYEKNRIVPESFRQTGMGRDLLAEDYMLKQITASLIYPEDEIGRKFWKRIYEEAYKKFGTTNIPVNTFNKVWIVPEKAVVYENAKAGTAYVVESKLKVMLDQDYLSLQKHSPPHSFPHQGGGMNALGSQIVREIVIPELTKEVNEDKNFSQLRQVYNSLILATWYKKKIQDSILSQVYADKNKIAGVNIDDPQEKERIYQRYLQAFKKGVYNYVKEDLDPVTREIVPRKYFSGGTSLYLDGILKESEDSSMLASAMDVKGHDTIVKVMLDQAMNSSPENMQTNKSREELKEFGFSFHGKQVSWDPSNNKHSEWTPQTQWSPKEGELDVKQMRDLPSIEVEGMVPLAKASHLIFLAVADVDGRRQPVVIKQFLNSRGEPGYYAMAFVPGESKQSFKVAADEAKGNMSELKAKRKAITAYFIMNDLHPPEEFIYTPDGNVIPIDAETLYFTDDRPVPNEEPAKEYIFSQLGGPKFYGLVRFKSNDAAMNGTNHVALFPDNDDTRVVVVVPAKMILDPKTSDLIKRIKAGAGDFAMTNDNNGHVSLTFKVKEKIAGVRASLNFMPWERHAAKALLAGTILFSPIALLAPVSERSIGVLDMMLVSFILILELKERQEKRFIADHEYYYKVLKGFYEKGKFTNGHTTREVLSFYKSNYTEFVDNLDDDQEVQTLMLLAGTLTKDEADVLRKNKKKVRFEHRLEWALDELAARREEFIKVHDTYLSQLREADQEKRKVSSKVTTKALKFYNQNDQDFMTFLPKQQRDEIAQLLADNLSTMEKNRILTLKPKQRTAIQELMYWDLEVETAEEGEKDKAMLVMEVPRNQLDSAIDSQPAARENVQAIKDSIEARDVSPEVMNITKGKFVKIDGQTFPALLVARALLAIDDNARLEPEPWDKKDSFLLFLKLSVEHEKSFKPLLEKLIKVLGQNLTERVALAEKFYAKEDSKGYGVLLKNNDKGNQAVIKGIVSGWVFEMLIQKIYPSLQGATISLDKAMGAELRGGIDLTPARLNVQTQSAGGIKFHLDPAMLAQLQNAPGFYPQVISIEPLNNLRKFLGITDSQIVY